MSDHLLLAAILRSDLGTFVAKVFQTISPGDAYIHNWHIDAIVHELGRVSRGETRRLIITQPPRSLKSICASVAFVAWSLGHWPTLRFACASYSNELGSTLARQFRTVVRSDWYQSLFPAMQIEKDTESECVTNAGGGRFTVPVGGSFTGRGADIVVIDDPMKASDARSDLARGTVNDWYRTTLFSRLNDKEKGTIVLTMQRLHEDDLAGVLIRQGGWCHLDLPAIGQEDRYVSIGPNSTHLFRKGEALQPGRESLETLADIAREMGSLAFGAQYLQRPIPLDGNIIKRKWIKWYDTLPPNLPRHRVVQSWDVASTIGGSSDWSVCSTWISSNRNYFLIDVWRGQLEFPDLKKRMIHLAMKHKPDSILIEHAGAGLHLIQEVRASPIPGVPLPIGIKPTGDKIVRMEAQSARFEAGQVHFPTEAPWLGELLHEILGFPHARHDDQVDSFSQFLNWAETSHLYEPTVSLAAPIIIRP